MKKLKLSSLQSIILNQFDNKCLTLKLLIHYLPDITVSVNNMIFPLINLSVLLNKCFFLFRIT